ncbi:monovalent cation/H(+) antiporter subunit G [Rehaibacterium terrae]|uniref:Multicomponent Na+:H+ antiporter subunit G n=1 Tax=Rehaibacterium terrae TaxID=1341696 RepID=A0A7W7V8S7_9GAMM|nr:monovalent cation/H(+) antiporter subunit G [Rehaibacterium terrae]MBB5014401.1 multicomponent Na+:H+ antiporter subunit G [Rehaibacterium terrae]
MTMLGFVLAGAGVLLLVIAALGLFLLPDALSRQHAATKSGTLALGLLLIGAALVAGDPGWWIRVALILVFLLLTLPVASHLLARAAARHAYTREQLREARDPEIDR